MGRKSSITFSTTLRKNFKYIDSSIVCVPCVIVLFGRVENTLLSVSYFLGAYIDCKSIFSFEKVVGFSR